MPNPARLHRVLETLKQRLREAEDLADPWAYFHDELAMDAELMSLGKPAKNERLTLVLGHVAARLLGRAIVPTRKLFIHVPSERLWHGTCHLEHHPMVLFYFDDIDMGLAGFIEGRTDSRTELIRFTCIALPDGALPSRGRGIA